MKSLEISPDFLEYRTSLRQPNHKTAQKLGRKPNSRARLALGLVALLAIGAFYAGYRSSSPKDASHKNALGLPKAVTNIMNHVGTFYIIPEDNAGDTGPDITEGEGAPQGENGPQLLGNGGTGGGTVQEGEGTPQGENGPQIGGNGAGNPQEGEGTPQGENGPQFGGNGNNGGAGNGNLQGGQQQELNIGAIIKESLKKKKGPTLFSQIDEETAELLLREEKAYSFVFLKVNPTNIPFGYAFENWKFSKDYCRLKQTSPAKFAKLLRDDPFVLPPDAQLMIGGESVSLDLVNGVKQFRQFSQMSNVCKLRNSDAFIFSGKNAVLQEKADEIGINISLYLCGENVTAAPGGKKYFTLKDLEYSAKKYCVDEPVSTLNVGIDFDVQALRVRDAESRSQQQGPTA